MLVTKPQMGEILHCGKLDSKSSFAHRSSLMETAKSQAAQKYLYVTDFSCGHATDAVSEILSPKISDATRCSFIPVLRWSHVEQERRPA